MAVRSLKLYIDIKSPYAFLAKDPAYALERDTGVLIDWLPYTLDIPAYLGSAKVDAQGNVLEQSRNAHQWRRVKYSYMDVRREANRVGLTIRGPRKIFDSSLAHLGLLFAKRQGVLKPYLDTVYARFWRRDLDIEDPGAIARVLAQAGADISGLPLFLSGSGRQELQRIQAEAEAAGVFGVPSVLMEDGELFWGREHLPRIRELLTA
jgi:2-hydroxychromene-2-carboxylate isomerase